MIDGLLTSSRQISRLAARNNAEVMPETALRSELFLSSRCLSRFTGSVLSPPSPPAIGHLAHADLAGRIGHVLALRETSTSTYPAWRRSLQAGTSSSIYQSSPIPNDISQAKRNEQVSLMIPRNRLTTSAKLSSPLPLIPSD
jgi:hypothetical protein